MLSKIIMGIKVYDWDIFANEILTNACFNLFALFMFGHCFGNWKNEQIFSIPFLINAPYKLPSSVAIRMINIRTVTYNTDMTVFCEFYPDYIFLKRKIESPNRIKSAAPLYKCFKIILLKIKCCLFNILV